jgi:hypothetical protein
MSGLEVIVEPGGNRWIKRNGKDATRARWQTVEV